MSVEVAWSAISREGGVEVIETLRSYMQLAAGLLESTGERAKDSATNLLSQSVEASQKGPEVVSAQVQGIAEDLIEQSRTNRELLVGLVRTEVERTVGRMGFVREEELAAVRRHVERLERELNQRGDQAAGAANLAVSTATAAVPAATRAATQAATQAAAKATETAAKATGTAVKASKAAAGTAARTTTKTEAPAKKATAKKAPAKKAPAKKTAAKKTTTAKKES